MHWVCKVLGIYVMGLASANAQVSEPKLAELWSHLTDNLEVQQLKSLEAVSSSKSSQEFRNYIPQLSLNSEYPIGTKNALLWLEGRISIYDQGKTSSGVSLFESEASMYKNLRSDLIRKKKIEVINLYYSILALLAEKSYLQIGSERIKKIEKYNSALYSKKSLDKITYLQIKSRVLQLRSEIYGKESEINRTEKQLSSLLNIPALSLKSSQSLQKIKQSTIRENLSSLKDKAIASSMFLKTKESKLNVVREQKSLAFADQRPNLGVLARYGSPISDIGEKPSSFYAGVQLQVPIPLFESFTITPARREEFKQKEFQVEIEAQQEFKRIEQLVEEIYGQLNLLNQSSQINEENVESVELSLNREEKRFFAGENNVLEYVTSLDQWSKVHLNQVQTIRNINSLVQTLWVLTND